MATIVLHIGAGKTGTSALQAAFTRNRAFLAARGVLYPPGAGDLAAKQLRVTSGNGLELAEYLNPGRRPGMYEATYPERVVSIANEFDGDAILYSSEFLQNFQEDRMEDLVETLGAAGHAVRVVLYVRHISGHAMSSYSQRVKRHCYVGDFGTFLQNDYRCSYGPTLERVTKVFDREAIRVKLYDVHKEQLFEDFLADVLGLDLAEESDVDFVKAKVNRSLSDAEIEFMRRMNRNLNENRHSAFVSDALIYADSARDYRYTITPEELSVLSDRFGETVARVNTFLRDGALKLHSDEVVVGPREQMTEREFEDLLLRVMARVVQTLLLRPA